MRSISGMLCDVLAGDALRRVPLLLSNRKDLAHFVLIVLFKFFVYQCSGDDCHGIYLIGIAASG